MGHSRIASLGLDYQSSAFNMTFDYVHDIYVAKGQEVASNGKTKSKKEDNIKTNAVLNLSVEAGSVTPFAHFSIFNVRDYTAAGQDEPKANAATTAFNDNGKFLGVGFHINGVSKKLRPFLAAERRNGNFVNAKGDEEQMEENLFRLGLSGHF